MAQKKLGKNDACSKEDNFAVQTFDLTKKYGKRIAVNLVNLSIREGELFALLGPNGAGKTTVIKMLSCLLQPTAGTAKVMGYDINKEAAAVKKIMNISPQETAISGRLNAWENLELMGGVYGLSKAETHKKAKELLDLMGLSRRTKEQVRKFSGGMQRRLSIAMALISDPHILYLDEPTLGLDPRTRRDLWNQIQELKGKKTIFLTTHYLEEADALADRVAIIREGDIAALGTPTQLKNLTAMVQTMVVKGQHITDELIEGLKKFYPDTRTVEKGIEIKSNTIDFGDVIDYLRSQGVKIEWLTMSEPSLDDVFLSLTGEEAIT